MPPLQPTDYWRVASYGYPNPFRREEKPDKAWTALHSFREYDGRPYKALKAFWGSPQAPRDLNSHAIESWKQAFEQFGLLYVITRSNRIVLTPGGHQLFAAADACDEAGFVWVGLNLVLRYPLKGPPSPRKPKSTAHAGSDLLPYRFLLSAMRDLDDRFWWAEFNRVLCRVFRTADAAPTVQLVRELRMNPARHADYPPAEPWQTGGAYNSLNQVPLHAGLNHSVLLQDANDLYGDGERPRHHYINPIYRPFVDAALGSPVAGGCNAGSFVDRLPAVPSFIGEQDYFDYLGAAVPSLAETTAAIGPKTLTLAGNRVIVLQETDHFRLVPSSGSVRVVEGRSAVLCRIALGHRVILSTDLAWTYLVVEKSLAGPNSVRLSLRRAKPIVSAEPIRQLLGSDNA